MLLPSWPPWLSVIALGSGAGVLVVVALRLVPLLDVLADRTRVGEALIGGVLLGATTSIPGLLTTVVVAADGDASFAVSNAVGSVAVQTLFIVVADILYRRANLEHAAASLPNILQALTLVLLLGLVVFAVVGPSATIVSINPLSGVLVLIYVGGLVQSRRAGSRPMWQPERTSETVEDEPETSNEEVGLGSLVASVAAYAALLAVTGLIIAHSGQSLAEETGVSSSVIGASVTGTVTSLPELVTLLVAVKVGALALAVGDIIGGNTFDVLFLVAADVAYRDGGIYQAMDQASLVAVVLTVVLTTLLSGGLLMRDRKGIGFEGWAIPICYAGGLASMVAVS